MKPSCIRFVKTCNLVPTTLAPKHPTQLHVITPVTVHALPVMYVQFSTSVCKPAGNNTNRLCRYLPMIQEQVGLGMRNIMAGNSLIALLGLACVITGSWHMWELAYVEKKATKHKRRRRHRKHAIPWWVWALRQCDTAQYAAAPAWCLSIDAAAHLQ